MTHITVARRARLGKGSSCGLRASGLSRGQTYTDSLSGTTLKELVARETGMQESTFTGEQRTDLVVRWGYTGHLNSSLTGVPIMNNPSAIHQVNNKLDFALRVSNEMDGQLPVLTSDTCAGSPVTASSRMASLSSPTTRWVLRARRHAQGRRMYKVFPTTLARVLRRYSRPLADGWYMRPRIQKAAEYRVYVVCGKVVAVARKTPGDPTKTAWNVARGGRFDLVRWDDWPLDVCRVAIGAFNLSELHFGGVDIMVEEGTNNPYFIEINSAPSLPLTSTRTHTTRHDAMARAFEWHAEYGRDRINCDSLGYEGWRSVIHPAIWGNHSMNSRAA